MANIGAFCFPGTGHLNPMISLARCLQRRGHRIVLFGIADTEHKVRAAAVEFRLIGEQDYPSGTLLQLDQALSRQRGLNTFRFTVQRVKNYTRMVLRDGPSAVTDAKLDALLVDEADMAGSVAEFLRIPFVSIAFFPPLLRDDTVPPFCFGWRYSPRLLSRMRNRMGAALLRYIASPIFTLVNNQRKAWSLPTLQHPADALSGLAQIAQLPESLEFPNPTRPAHLHYTGPFVDGSAREPVPFPWERLDGRPLIYASMGTLQNRSEKIFRTIADACAGIGTQLVLSLGGGMNPEELGNLPGDPVVVRYAPQLELVKRSSAVITHGGLNTTLESLAEGVPLVVIPLGNDQPGVGARVAQKKAGIVVPFRRLDVQTLRRAAKAVVYEPTYRASAQAIQASMQQINALEIAAEIIERSLGWSRFDQYDCLS